MAGETGGAAVPPPGAAAKGATGHKGAARARAPLRTPAPPASPAALLRRAPAVRPAPQVPAPLPSQPALQAHAAFITCRSGSCGTDAAGCPRRRRALPRAPRRGSSRASSTTHRGWGCGPAGTRSPGPRTSRAREHDHASEQLARRAVRDAKPGGERVLVALHLVHPRATLELEAEVLVPASGRTLEVGGDQWQVAGKCPGPACHRNGETVNRATSIPSFVRSACT